MATYLTTYPNSITQGQGLISALSEIATIPWNVLTSEQKQDIERLYAIRSGFKEFTPSFIAADTAARARLLAAMFAQKWTRVWEDYTLEYNQLDAYKVTEQGQKEINSNVSDVTKYGKTESENGTDTGSVSREGSDSLIHGKVVTETGTDTGTVQTAGQDDNNSTEAIYGFNSTLPVNAGAATDNTDSTSTETRNLEASKNTENSGTDVRDSTDTETRNLSMSKTLTNSGQDEKTYTNEENENYSYTKSGNIGYTTPQELIRQNLELWKIPFFGIVFADIDEFVMISVY